DVFTDHTIGADPAFRTNRGTECDHGGRVDLGCRVHAHDLASASSGVMIIAVYSASAATRPPTRPSARNFHTFERPRITSTCSSNWSPGCTTLRNLAPSMLMK